MNKTTPDIRQGPRVWKGPDMMAQPDKWVYGLNQNDIEELEQAAEQFMNSGKSLPECTSNHFPLPNFSRVLSKFRLQLIHGIGFGLLRGLPIKRYSEKEYVTIFYGLGCHLGSPRSQNAAGHLLGHVRNQGKNPNDPTVRIYQTNARQTFHTDSCDVVGLLCVQPAKEGGLSLLVSADTVYNHFLQRRPDLVNLLLQPIATDRRGEVPEGEKPWLEIPILSYHQGQLTPFYQRQYIESAQRFADAPPLTSRHIEALDLFDELCNSPELHLTMMLEKGDMQFVYNHGMLHDRTGFIDFKEPELKRHLARLWLSIPGDRELPVVFKTRFGSIEPGNRGGIHTPTTVPTIPWLSKMP